MSRDPRIVILGARRDGHANVVREVIRRAGCATIIGFLDDDPTKHGGEIHGLPILGPTSRMREMNATHFIAAVGDCEQRRQLYEIGIEAGLEPWTGIDPAATVLSGAKIGPGSAVIAGAVVNVDTKTGCNVIINTAATVDHNCVLADHVNISPGCHLGGRVHVEEGAFLGVRGRSKPARGGRMKTGHFEGKENRRRGSSALVLKEAGYGESTRDGGYSSDTHTPRTGMVEPADRPGAWSTPRDGGAAPAARPAATELS